MVYYLSKEYSALCVQYCNFMEEIKSRLDLVNNIMTYSLPGYAAHELCYLQFRMACELVALSALTAHGDLPATKKGKLAKAYEADLILNALERLNPQFYPKPGTQILSPTGKVERVDPIKSGFLTKQELLRLYRDCGHLLHRGTLRKMRDPRENDFKRIRETLEKFTKLLNHHAITLSDPKYNLWVIMHASQDGRVHSAITTRLASTEDADVSPSGTPGH